MTCGWTTAGSCERGTPARPAATRSSYSALVSAIADASVGAGASGWLLPTGRTPAIDGPVFAPSTGDHTTSSTSTIEDTNDRNREVNCGAQTAIHPCPTA